MSARAGQWDDDDIEDLLDEQGGDDSSVIKNLRAALRAQTKKVREMQTEIEQVRTTSRQSTIADLLKARNVNPKVAAFIPKDVEATEEALGAWLTEYGDVFGAAPRGDGQEQQQSGPTQEQIAAMRQMDVMAGAASPAVTNDLLQQVRSAESPEALLALIHSAGGGS